MFTPEEIALLGFVANMRRYIKLNDRFKLIVDEMIYVASSEDINQQDLQMTLDTIDDLLNGLDNE